MIRLFLALLLLATPSFAQQEGPLPEPSSSKPSVQQTALPANPITVPAGTKITLTLAQPIWSAKSAPGDSVYAVTSFPVSENNRIAVPAGTYVDGFLDTLIRPHWLSPHAEFQMHFAQMVFANGYSVPLFGSPSDSSITAAPGYIAIPSNTTDPVEQALLLELGGPGRAPTAHTYVDVASNSDILLDNGTRIEMVLQHRLVLDGDQVLSAATVSKAPQFSGFVSSTQCRPVAGTPGTPGTPDTVIPGTPGTPSTVISQGPGLPDVVIPGTPATPPTVIPGSPGTPGTPGISCPAPPLVAAVPVDTNSHSESFSVAAPLTLNGQQLSKGNYKASWSGSGNNVQILVTQKKSPKIIALARVVILPEKPGKTLATPRTNPDGSQSLQSLRFKGKTAALYFLPPSAAPAKGAIGASGR